MMTEKFVLDTNIISKLCLPKHPDNMEIACWFRNFIIKNDIELFLPEIVRYEARRGLTLKNLKEPNYKGLTRFEQFSKMLTFLPIKPTTFETAEDLWAKAHFTGKMSASKEALDGDILLAAQAIDIDASVISENVKHLKNYVTTYHWKHL